MRHTTDNCASSCTAQTVADYQIDPRFQAPKQKNKKTSISCRHITLSVNKERFSLYIYCFGQIKSFLGII